MQRWLNRPAAPYIAFAISPLVMLPIAAIVLESVPDCGVDEPWWELRHFELALLPGLAAFLPFLWLSSGKRDVRRAAAVAGAIGGGRYAILQVATLLASLDSAGQGSNADCTVSIFFAVAVLLPLMIILWAISVVIAGLALLRAKTE